MSGRARQARGATREPTVAREPPSFQQQARSAELQRAIELIRECSASSRPRAKCEELCRALRLVADLEERCALNDVKDLGENLLRRPMARDRIISQTHDLVICELARTLGCIGTAESARSALVRIRAVGDTHVVNECGLALARLGCVEAVPFLIAKSQSLREHSEDSNIVLNALFRIGTREALVALADASLNGQLEIICEMFRGFASEPAHAVRLRECVRVFFEHMRVVKSQVDKDREAVAPILSQFPWLEHATVREVERQNDGFSEEHMLLEERPVLRRYLERPSPNRLVPAFYELREFGGVGVLVKFACSRDEDLMDDVLPLLKKCHELINHEQSIKLGRSMLHQHNPSREYDHTPLWFAELFGNLRFPENVDVLCRLRKRKNPKFKEAAAVGLVQAAAWSEDAARRLASFIKEDDDFKFRKEAIRLLPASYSRMTEVLNACLDDENTRIRRCALLRIYELRLFGFEERIVSRMNSDGELDERGAYESGYACSAIRVLGEINLDGVMAVLKRAYLTDADAGHKKRFFESIVHLHTQWLERQKGTEHPLHQKKPWGYEDFEILNERKGLTRLHMNPRVRVRDLPVQLNEESDLSHHFVGEGEDREFCYSTSFHFHAAKDVTIVVNSGQIKIVYDHDKKEAILSKGTRSSMDLPAGMPHQIINVGTELAEVLEFEFPPCKDDIRRLEDPYARTGTGYATT